MPLIEFLPFWLYICSFPSWCFFYHSSCPWYLEAKHHWQPSCSPAPSFCFCYVSCHRAPLTPLPGIEPLWEGTDGSRLRPSPSSRQWVPVPCAAERALAWPHVPCWLPMGTVVMMDTLKKLPQPLFPLLPVSHPSIYTPSSEQRADLQCLSCWVMCVQQEATLGRGIAMWLIFRESLWKLLLIYAV